MRQPTSGRRRSRPHRPWRLPRPAPGSLPGDRRHQPGKRRAVDLVGPRSCGSPWRPSSRSAGVLPSRIRQKLTRLGQPIAMRNSSTSAIGRTTGRRPSNIGTRLAEIDAVIVPAAPDLPPFTLAEGPQGDVECLQGWSTTGGWRPESRPAFLRQGTDRPNASPHATGTRESANTRRRRTACSCGDF